MTYRVVQWATGTLGSAAVEAIQAHPDLELLAPAPLNVVCFRYAPSELAAEQFDALNQRLLVTLQERGIAVPSSTVLDGQFAIRVAITNHRTRRSDIESSGKIVAGDIGVVAVLHERMHQIEQFRRLETGYEGD